jgi:hypothetical protein
MSLRSKLAGSIAARKSFTADMIMRMPMNAFLL